MSRDMMDFWWNFIDFLVGFLYNRLYRSNNGGLCMKRILALFLCAVLFFSAFGATAGAATQSETAQRDQAAEEIKKDIEEDRYFLY